MSGSSASEAAAAGSGSSSGKRRIGDESTVPSQGCGLARHVAGLWIGEAAPAPELASSVPVNPITWSLALNPDAVPPAPSAFGGGYFDDAGDVPGKPVLLFSLDGSYSADSSEVKLTKRYVSHNIPEIMTVTYEGSLSREADGALVLKGTWVNVLEETNGVFGCRLEPMG